MLKGKVRLLTAAGAALAVGGVAAGFALVGGGAALAAGGGGPQPPWYSLYNSSNAPLGGITFYNAQGQVVTGGDITANGLAAYAVADTADPLAPHLKATLYIYTPVSGANPLTWSNAQISSSTSYPNTAAPVPVSGTANPAESNNGTDQSVQSYINDIPNTDTSTTDGYGNLYDVRLRVSGGTGGITSEFWDAVIKVDITGGTASAPTAGTWTVDYPDYTQSTTTTLTATPSTETTSAPITLNATVAPATAGTVSFWQGSTQVGTTQTVSSGTASVTATPPSGTTAYTAIYTPVIGSADIGSSGTLSYTVGTAPPPPPPPAPPTWEPVLFGPNKVGQADDCLAAFKGATSAPTYAWQSNGTAITGVTGSTFVIPAAELGDTLTCTVTASNSGGSVSGTSAGETVLLGSPLVPVKKPVLSGKHEPGKAESVSAGRWSPAATKVTYQWYVGSSRVRGATKASFTVPRKDKNKKVHCVVTASANGYANGSYATPSVKIT